MCAVGNQYNPFPAQRAEWKTTTHAQHSLGVWVGYTLLHTHSNTAMPTCLSIRFYHHRDTVDSSFVRPEKIGALRSQNTTFIMIYKGCMHLYACFWEEKVKDLNWWNKNSLCVCFSVCENLYVRFLLAFCACVLMFLALRELLQHIEVSGCCVSEKERRSNINTEPLLSTISNQWGSGGFTASAEMSRLSKHWMSGGLNEWLKMSTFQELRDTAVFLGWPFIFNIVRWSVKVVS